MPARSVDSAPSKEIKIAAFGADPTGIDAFSKFASQTNSTVRMQHSEPLIYIDPDGKIIPALATSWKKSSPTDWVFELRKGVKFHNGEAFDAHSVKFTLEKIIDPSFGSGFANFLTSVKGVSFDEKDVYTVTVHLKHPDGLFPRQMVFVSMTPPGLVKEKGIDWYREHPVGTGPFVFDHWTHNQEIVLKKNKEYWNPGLPEADRLTFLIIRPELALQALMDGTINALPYVDGRHTLRIMETRRFKIVKKLTSYQTLGLLQLRGPLALKPVRQALNYAIDRQEMIRFADYGNAIPSESLGAKGCIGKNEDLTPYPFDLSRAKALLAKTPYSKGFSLRVAAQEASAAIAKILKVQLQLLGVDLHLEFRADHWTHLSEYTRSHQGKRPDYDLLVFGNGNNLADIAFVGWWGYHSSSYHSMLVHPEYDRKIEEAIESPTEEDYLERLKSLDKWFKEEALAIFTTQRIVTLATTKNLEIEMPVSGGFQSCDALARAHFKP